MDEHGAHLFFQTSQFAGKSRPWHTEVLRSAGQAAGVENSDQDVEIGKRH
ncbi:MAG: hypothetical protein ACJAZO_002984 [Myxococcota bacterium]|jgi:hypothetical protein